MELTNVEGEVLASAPVPALGGLEVSEPLELVVAALPALSESRMLVRVALTDEAPAQCDTANDVAEWDFSADCPPLR